MTYKQGCQYAALLGIPCLIFDLLVRIPPLYHMESAHALAQIVLAPGWQVVHWLTGGVMGRGIEYKLLMPLLIIGINVLVWGAVIWSVGNVVATEKRVSDL